MFYASLFFKKYYILHYYIMSCFCNFNDIVNELSVQNKPNPLTLDYVWYDISNSVVAQDASGHDLSLNRRVIVSNSVGDLSLNVQNRNSDTVYDLPNAYNLVDDLFQNVNGSDFYQEYLENYQSQTNTSEMYDLSLSSVADHESGFITLDTVNRSNNTLSVNLAQLLGTRSLVVESTEVHLGTNFDFLSSVNVSDVSNNLIANFHPFGVNISNVDLWMGDVSPKVSLYVNSLSPNSTVRFEADASENKVGANVYPKPSLALSKLLPSSVSVGSGRQLVNVSVTLPSPDCFKTGCWNWKVYVVDNRTGYVSSKQRLKVTVLSPFSQPIVSVNSFGFQSDISGSRPFNVKYALADVTNVDISAQGGRLGVSAEVVTFANNVYTSFNNNWLAVTTGSENMSSRLSADASANFVLSYDQRQFCIENLNYYVRISYQSQEFSVKYIYIPINVSGITHITPVVATNNYNGTFTLSGGNKANVGEAYFYKVNGQCSQYVEISGNVLDTTIAQFNGKCSFECAVGPINPLNLNRPPVYHATVSATVSIGQVHKISLDISTGSMFGTSLQANVFDVDGDGNVLSVGQKSSKSVQIQIDNMRDVFVNFSKPRWFTDVPNLSLVVDITETGNNGNLVGFDLSGGSLDISNGVLAHALKLNSNTYRASIVGASKLNDGSPSIDLMLKEERLAPSEITCVATLKFLNNGTEVVIQTVSAVFVITSTVSLNNGDCRNNLVLLNRTKINLSRVFSGAMTSLSSPADVLDVSNFELSDISNNTWRNLALGVNAMFYANLPRSEFMGRDEHIFDISGLNIETSHSNSSTLNMFLPYSVYGELSNPAPISLTQFGDVSANFSTYSDIFIDTGFFTGVIDIQYSTVFRGEHSATLNTLRIFVVPRPEITFVARDPSLNVCRLNAPTWLVESVRNMQLDGQSDVTYCPRGRAINARCGKDMSDLLRKYSAVTFKEQTFSVLSGLEGSVENLFDVSDNFTTVNYGSTQSGLVKFVGTDLAHNTGDISNNFHLLNFESSVSFTRHPYILVNNVQDGKSPFKIFIINDTDEVMAADTILTTNVHVNSGIHLNNISLARYVVATSNVDLRSEEFATSVLLFIENSNHNDIVITYGCGDTETIQFAERASFMRSGNRHWTFHGKI